MSVADGENRAFPSLEGLRLLASVAIVAWHYLHYLGAPVPGFHLAVDLFFVISGIVIAHVYSGRTASVAAYADFIRRRIARLYPLHLATLGFYVLVGFAAVYGLLRVDNPAKYNFGELLPNLLMTHAWRPWGEISFNYVSWSISAEFFVYLCFPLIAFVVARSFYAGLAAIVLSLAVAIAVSHGLLDLRMTILNWQLGALRAVPSFALGVWLYAHRDRLVQALGSSGAARALMGFRIFGVALVALLAVNAHDYALLVCVYGVVAFAFLCDLVGRRTLVSWRPLSSRGYLTYSIYMLHTVVATIVIAVLPRIFGTSPWATAGLVTFAALVTFCLAELSYRYFETPLRGAINRWPRRRKKGVVEGRVPTDADGPRVAAAD